jgi:hypothetical protein
MRQFVQKRFVIVVICLVDCAECTTRAYAAADDAPPAAVLAVPDAGAQEKAMRSVKKVFKDEVDAAKTPAAKLDLAKNLLQRGIENSAEPAEQYVLLRMARDYAIAAADAGLAMQAVDELAHSFQIDPLTSKLETLTSLSKVTMIPVQGKAFAETANAVADEAITADNYEIAKQATTLGLTAAKRTRDPDLNKQMVGRTKEVETLEAAYRGVKAAQAALEEKPLDPAANLAVGRYRVLVKSDWERGVPMLALGGDPKLKELAVQELDASESGDDQLKLADAWADYAATLEASAKDRVESRSLYWYTRALPLLSGLQKLRVEKMLQDAGGKVFVRIQNALRAKKIAISRPAGSIRGPGGFFDVLDEGGLLVGLEIGTIDVGGQRYIRSIRPIYHAARGEIPGALHGSNRGETITLKAKEGFAVGGIAVKAGSHVEAIAITFMQSEGLGLNPRNSYNSQWLGGDGGGQEFHLGGSGSPVVGVTGKITAANNSSVLEGLSTISLR